jgi:hypothetical protein
MFGFQDFRMFGFQDVWIFWFFKGSRIVGLKDFWIQEFRRILDSGLSKDFGFRTFGCLDFRCFSKDVVVADTKM